MKVYLEALIKFKDFVWLLFRLFGVIRELTTEAQKCVNNIVIKVAKATQATFSSLLAFGQAIL